MRPHIFAGLFAALGLTMSSAPLAAQEWRVSAQAGRIRSALDPAPSESFALGLSYDDANTGLRLSGGVPTHSADPLRGGASAWKRLSMQHGGLLAGLDVAGNAFLAFDRAGQRSSSLPGLLDPSVPTRVDRSGHALAGQAMPVLGYEWAAVQLQARAGVSRYAAKFGDQRADRSVTLADLQATVTPTSSLAIVPVVRRFQAPGEAAAMFTGISAVTASTVGSLWASVGQWTGGRSEGTPWSVGGRLSLHPLVSLDGAVRRDTYDPLALQPAQTSWSIGLSVLASGRARPVAPPVAAAYVNGRATIQLPVSATNIRPSIAGDFNAWKPVPMERVGDHWTYTVAVARGVYNYSFVGADGTWFVPDGVPGRKDDGMGGVVAVVVVR
ncbi:MAG TPA: hypothetical protein VF461_15640 [Gemmatimonadaceae bacterium]